MPAKAKTRDGGISAADVDAKLPRGFFVKRGDIQAAFGFTKDDTRTLVEVGTFRAEYPFGKNKKARFQRTLVLAVARKWEAAS